MKTFRRDRLRRLVEQGKVWVVHSYHFDDVYGSSGIEKEMPAAINPADWRERKEGVCYLHKSDFEGHGHAYLDEAGFVHLHVHSNCNYTLKVYS